MKKWSINMVLVDIPKLVLILQMWMLTVRGVLLRVTLKTAGCSQNCSLTSSNYNRNKCVSSILINGNEYSYQKDGLNIAIIDNNLGNISAHHINSFKERARENILTATEKKDWKNFVRVLPKDFTVIVVSQNICANFYKRWYTNLQKAGINIVYSPKYNFNHNITVFVGCKGSCPDWSNVKIPFRYSGNDIEFKKSFAIKVNESVQPMEEGKLLASLGQSVAEKDPNTIGRNRGHMGTILGGIIAVVFAICIIAVIYVTNKRPSNNRALLCCNIKEATLAQENLRKMQNGRCENTKEMHLIKGEKKGQTIGPTNVDQQQKLSSSGPLQSALDETDDLPNFTDICIQSTLCTERAYSSPEKTSHEMYSPEASSPFLCGKISKEASNNDPQRQTTSEQRQTSSNITSVSSLVDNDCHRSDPALLQPGTSILTSDSFLNEKRPSRSNSSRRHYRRHSRRGIQRHSSCIGRSESTPDVVSDHHCCHQVFELSLKPLQQNTMMESFKF